MEIRLLTNADDDDTNLYTMMQCPSYHDFSQHDHMLLPALIRQPAPSTPR